MKAFATLIKTLDSTNKTNAKMDAIISFLQVASNADKLWSLALFTGKRPKRMVNSAMMKQWAMQEANIPEWLFVESYLSVGDLGETIALILPPAKHFWEFSLSEWMDKIAALQEGTEAEKKIFVVQTWHHLDLTERFIFNKLIGGSFRIGVSAKTLINAIAKHFQLESSAVAHAIMGDWNMSEIDFNRLILGKYTDTNLSKPYPFCLAYPLEKDLAELGTIDQWQIEYKWDGIRGQLIKRNGEIFIWSRGEELVSTQFPELVEDLKNWQGDFVLDGEILAYKDDKVLDFSELQKRLNRKTISKKMQEEIPIVLFAYDLLEIDGEDLRSFSMSKRRGKLEVLFQKNPSEKFFLSKIIAIKDWTELPDIRANARAINSEGVMLKNLESSYHVGRKKGDWWKWKIEPMTIDAVLIYAQKGSGRRSSYYTDYTFAVKKDDQLVTIAKAYSGLTDKEILEVSRFVNKNAIEKFGPVRTVKPELVFEIAFEGIGFSNRHKSGVALRFPRILRWRKDKTVQDIDDIETIKEMIH
ncbi:MAG: ATP-dependent DNA ligase [Pseudopedobacter saltans]|uniref:DNA ligase (ATP) n=1 Tax=Pseudopedobacter saltans TaxID=151895 RepID=A0A2W5GSS9_9SPHI|nr:MAG: ATP-dependent DNA ligase [Pseudopedobacter saltans]